MCVVSVFLMCNKKTYNLDGEVLTSEVIILLVFSL